LSLEWKRDGVMHSESGGGGLVLLLLMMVVVNDELMRVR